MMHCIFCKQPSQSSRSVEHIVPESLGNKEHILPKGVVCDCCNNYFATKIEKDLLEQPYFKSIRSRNNILNKKGKCIAETGIISHPKGGEVGVFRSDEGLSIDTVNGNTVNLISSGQVNKLYIPIYSEPEKNNLPLSRLLGKMAIEALAHRLMKVTGWEQELTYKNEIDPLRTYVRYGNGKTKFWNYSQRRIYSELDSFVDTQTNEGHFEILHEYTFHYSEEKELFFIICIMGIEYAINLAGPDIDTYLELLKKTNGRSFLTTENEKKISNSSFLY